MATSVRDMTLAEMAAELDVARYADLDHKPRGNNWEMEVFSAALIRLVEDEGRPVTVRRVFYLAVSAKIVNKTEREAERVQKQVLALRRAGQISYEDIIDESRGIVVPPMWADAEDFVTSVMPQFRTDPWKKADTLVLVFVEKQGMVPILREVTERWGVPLFPTVGYTGETFVWDAAQWIRRRGWIGKRRKRVVVVQIGDLDNSGLDMVRDAEARLGRLADQWEVAFVRVAVLEEHIDQYDLPTRPQKQGDKRGTINVKRAVEIDAMDPDIVTGLLEDHLARYLPRRRLAAHEAADARGRSVFEKLARYWAAVRRFLRTLP
jgi:hypothetical protein